MIVVAETVYVETTKLFHWKLHITDLGRESVGDRNSEGLYEAIAVDLSGNVI